MNDKFKHYDIAEGGDIDSLRDVINAQLARGWVLVGGVSTTTVSVDENGRPRLWYAQALAKE